jgi:FKBP-type peptidyl-prolyl cis-trans isomerase
MSRRLLMFAVILFAVSVIAQTKKSDTAPTPVNGALTPIRAGLYYSDLVVGTGKEATSGKRVTVHYTGWLESGSKFDSSIGRRPYSFVLGNGDVIRGWDIGVEGMKVGGKRQLHIPSSLAYGMNGRPPVIPPDAKLIFEIELLDVSKK